MIFVKSRGFNTCSVSSGSGSPMSQIESAVCYVVLNYCRLYLSFWNCICSILLMMCCLWFIKFIYVELSEALSEKSLPLLLLGCSTVLLAIPWCLEGSVFLVRLGWTLECLYLMSGAPPKPNTCRLWYLPLNLLGPSPTPLLVACPCALT